MSFYTLRQFFVRHRSAVRFRSARPLGTFLPKASKLHQFRANQPSKTGFAAAKMPVVSRNVRKTGLDFRLLAATSFFERTYVGDGTPCGRTTSNKTAFVSCHDPFPPNAPLHPTPLRIFKLEKHTISCVAEIVRFWPQHAKRQILTLFSYQDVRS